MELEKTPGLTDAERAAILAYQEAHMEHAAAAMGALFDPADAEEKTRGLPRALARIEEAHARLVELAPAGTPGREGGPTYRELLGLLRGLGLGEREIVRPEDPPVPWRELPEARLLAFCCLDLMHYALLTGGAPDQAPGHASRERLYDVPHEVRTEMSEEEIAGAHGDRHELQMRLWRLLARAMDDSPEGRREKLWGTGYDCGYELRLFIALRRGPRLPGGLRRGMPGADPGGRGGGARPPERRHGRADREIVAGAGLHARGEEGAGAGTAPGRVRGARRRGGSLETVKPANSLPPARHKKRRIRKVLRTSPRKMLDLAPSRGE